jgi:hypothetical protein
VETDPESFLRDLFASSENEHSQADLADEQELEDRRQALRDRVCTIWELAWKETEQAEPLLGPLVRRGMTIVTGDEFLGWEGKGGTAFIIDLEQGLSVAQRRVYEAFMGKASHGRPIPELMGNVKLEGAWENVLYADWQEGVDLSQPGIGIDVVREYLEMVKPDVVMIDPVYKLFMGTDLNEQVAISSFVHEIQKLRTEYGFALILPMHPRKPGVAPQGLTMHDLYGSAVWSWWAEQIVMLRRPANAEGSVLGFEKDRIGDGPPIGSKWSLEFEPGRGFRRASGEAGVPGGDNRAMKRIYLFLQEPGCEGHYFSREDLAHRLDMSVNTIKKATESMVKRAEQGLYPGLVWKRDGHPLVYAYRAQTPPVPPSLLGTDTDEEW